MRGRNIKYFLLIAMSSLFILSGNAQDYVIVSDVKTEAIAASNVALIELMEYKDKELVKSTREKADSMAVMTTTWHTLNQLYHMGRTNINGFKYESALYQQIYAKFMDVVTKIPIALELTAKNPLSALKSYKDVLAIQRDIEGMAKQYTDVVTNGKVKNPLKKGTVITQCPKCGGDLKTINTGSSEKPHVYVCTKCGWNTDTNVVDEDGDSDGDGYNFLSFKDRYYVADRIYRSLISLDWRLLYIIYHAKQKMNGWEVLKCIDPETYYNLLSAQSITESSIERIKAFKCD